MKIVIFAGGTGSIALQTGLYNMLDRQLDGIDTKVIVNAYDNGLSTGAVRQVMDGKILGPSDVRKNQTTRLRLEKPNSPWLQFLDVRFTEETSKVRSRCYHYVHLLEEALNIGSDFPKNVLQDGIDWFFSSPIALKIDYTDFSLANIIYAGLARQNGNSLRAAAKIMAKCMGIKDNVLLNDDTSLFLGAITKSGKRITDEGDIVSWGKQDDPFVEVFFTNPQGAERDPILCKEAADAIIEADLIILSSGTQWSSLIPTYMSLGFQDAIAQSKATIVMVMNRQPDHDSPGQTASDIINILVPRFFDPKRLRVVVDPNGHPNMRGLNEEALRKVESMHHLCTEKKEADSDRTHSPRMLALGVACAYFSDFIHSDFFVFDYDDTLVGRGNVFPKSSQSNVHDILEMSVRYNLAICTGNSIKAINIKHHGFVDGEEARPLTVYADGGVNRYEYPTVQNNEDDRVAAQLVEHLDKHSLFTNDEVDEIISLLTVEGIPLSKIENRGNAIIAIKPIDAEYRNLVANLIKHLLRDRRAAVKTTGRTTIEIQPPGLTKMKAIEHIIRTNRPHRITYVGDEMQSGNDAVVREAQLGHVHCLEVTDPSHTAFFLKTMKEYFDVVPRG